MSADTDLCAVLAFVEQRRAAGDLFGTTGLPVARDMANECGWRLRVTGRRSVPVKKSNRPPKSVFGINASSYDLWRGNDAVVTGSLTRQHIDDALDALRLRDAINAPPPITVASHPFLADNEVFIMPAGVEPLQRVGAADLTFDYRNWWSALDGQWESERIFREIDDRQSLTFSSQGEAGQFVPGDWIQIGTERFGAGELYHWAAGDIVAGHQITEVDRVRGRVTITARQPGFSARLTGVTASPGALAPKSRVPTHVHRNRPRLDGRRR